MKCPYCGKKAIPPKCDYCKAAIEPEKKTTNTKKPEKEEK